MDSNYPDPSAILGLNRSLRQAVLIGKVPDWLRRISGHDLHFVETRYITKNYVNKRKLELRSVFKVAVLEISQLLIFVKSYASGPFIELIAAVKINSRSDFSVISGRDPLLD